MVALDEKEDRVGVTYFAIQRSSPRSVCVDEQSCHVAERSVQSQSALGGCMTSDFRARDVFGEGVTV